MNENPYLSYGFEGNTVHSYFCASKPTLDTKKLEKLIASDEEYKLKGNMFYLHSPSGIGRSKLVKSIELCLGVAATGRNLNTVLKIKEMAQDLQ